MKIIDLAICSDNQDPKHLGRIRYKIYSQNTGEIERAMSYTEWDIRDPFVALPFLPNNINFVPEIGQAVQIMVFDTDKERVNQVYIAGPFTTNHDFNSQSFSDQVQNTSYGAASKSVPDIQDRAGNLRDPRSIGAFAQHNHYGVYGKYGSDLIFTDNGLMLRGGKLLSKEAASPADKYKMLSTPNMSKKFSNIYLKKFPKKLTLQTVETPLTKVESSILKYVVEYDVDDLSNPTKVNVYAYKINKQPKGSNQLQTDVFTEYTDMEYSGTTLINLSGNTGSTPTFTFPITSIEDAYKEIRHILYTIHEDGLQGMRDDNINYALYNEVDIHPFYFRPTNEFRGRSNNIDKKIRILNNINLRKVGPGHGLIWSTTSPNPPVKTTIEKRVISKVNKNSSEQSFGTIISDNIFLLSTDTNETNKSIHFDELDKYELTQQDYVEKIQPNTYSIVRGEKLLEVLYAFANVLTTHIHNINDPYARQDYPQHDRLIKLLEQMENDILNRSIRVN